MASSIEAGSSAALEPAAPVSPVWRPKSQAIQPSNTIAYAAQTIRARIDATLPVNDVVRQLCLSFGITDPPLMWSLRSVEQEGDVLVTDDNLRDMVERKVPIRLAPSPAILAATAIASLSSPATTPSALKLTFFSLSKYLREPAFTAEFLALGGLRELVLVIDALEGNSLAYALGAVQVLMEQSDAGSGSSFEAGFVRRIIAILASASPPINISRPSAAILRALIPGAGFELVYRSICEQPDFLTRVVGRLRSQEGGEVLSSLMLLDSILDAATTGEQKAECLRDLDALGTQQAVQMLMVPPHDAGLTGSLLDFQSSLLRALHHQRYASVDTAGNTQHRTMLREVWEATGLETCELGIVDAEDGWADPLGLERQEGGRIIWRTGQLGLECLHAFAIGDDRPILAQLVHEQLSRAESHRCPVGQASSDVVDALVERWNVSGRATAATLAPLLLSFKRVHALGLRYFLRMWADSSALAASANDFHRVGTIVRSQLREVLRDEASLVKGGLAKAWQAVEDGLLRSEYRDVKERMMKEAEASDDVTQKPTIRNLRDAIEDECRAFVRLQRIHCLLEGAWFKHGTLVTDLARGSAQRNVPRGWTFVRLAPNRKHLAFMETQHKLSTRPTIEELNERIELACVTEVVSQTSYATVDPPPALAGAESSGSTLRASQSVNGSRRPAPSDLSFSLLSGAETSLLDLVALDRTQLSEWLDGIAALRNEPSHVAATTETEELIDQLTTVGLKLRLLDLQGEGVAIPDQLVAPPPPSNFNFCFQ